MEPYFLPGTPLQGPLELTNCDREPIHIPATIQSHGCMLVVRESDRLIVSVSENLGSWFDSDTDVVGQSIDQFDDRLSAVIDSVAELRDGKRVRRNCVIGKHEVVVSVHRCDGIFLIELEVFEEESNSVGSELIGKLFAGLEGKQLDEVYQSTIEIIRSFTGFDRVMLYKFHEDDHGSVIAEAKRDDQEAFLGLHYPAGDIPIPARKLYELNWIRLLADVNAEPVAMQPAMLSGEGGQSRPINMSYAQLRAISPIHLEYLRNMNVGASMSISILNGDRLWGLIACHHRTAKVLSPVQRDVCELAGSLLSTYLSSRRQEELLARRVEIGESIAKHVSKLANQDDLQQAILDAAPWLSELFSADGLVFRAGEELSFWGHTPTEIQTEGVLAQLDQRATDNLSFTDCISDWYPAADEYKDQVAGMLAIRLGRKQAGELVFFRRPYSSTIQWAGDPAKNEADESGRLSPRKSFAKFSQEVEGRSIPWSPAEREAAETLQATLNSVVVEQAARVHRINEELRQLNADLDAFAYAASHDLKEPLRGINHYLYMLEQAPNDDSTYQRGMTGLKRLVGRMSELLDGLLRFSRVGRQDLRWESFLLKDAYSQACDILFGGRKPEGLSITFNQAVASGESTTIEGDYACVREVLMNLMSNAVKYNDRSEKLVEVGQLEYQNSPFKDCPEFATNIFYVRDNGIGIAQQYREQVFEIFRRLHQHNQYGGGSGAGLTIVRRIVERHGGRVAIESDENAGTTFFVGWEPDS
ncbi:GAF domain-containing protein [Stieleria sp. JC731]|uniref:ATP-binding protein n=1 Tax=Pirellulaceae TaxID=2691357 RepID=UPI001E3DFB0A|nr:ATP-binding protein [Stieleria sp. JC731]MCC9599201.1 GAF domain-containing protein [Stieleria sp. JC731]